MKFFISLMAIVHFLPLFSQQTDISPALIKPGRFQLGIVIAPGISYRTLSNHDKSSAGQGYIKSRNKTEVSKTGFETGVSLKYSFSQKTGITTGIYFSNRGYRQKEKDAYWPTEVDSSGEYVMPTSTSALKSSYNFNSVEIPFILDYTFHKAKFSYSAGIGGSINYLLGAIFSYKVTEGNGNVLEGNSNNVRSYDRANVSMLLKTGVSYALNEKASIHMDPIFEYDITTLHDNVIVGEHLWTFGLHIGYFMTL